MTLMKITFTLKFWVMLLVWFLAGCTQTTPVVPVTATGTLRPLTPYWTPTATYPIPTLTPMQNLPVTPAPSPTPFTHLVVRGETMLGIALQYGVTFEALQAANPGVDPQFLSVGAALIIPLGDEIQVIITPPPPIALQWSEPNCYLTGDGGAWCFILVKNNLSVAVENLSAWIGLFDRDGEIAASQVAVGPINILRPGQAVPLITYLPAPLPTYTIARGELLTAVEIPKDDTRYLNWPLAEFNVAVIGDSSFEAQVAGRFEQPAGSPAPSQVWIAAVAYDLAGQVVGVRKLDTAGDLAFELTVYSLGEAIDRVELLSELRP
jgi:LysM repeat protein